MTTPNKTMLTDLYQLTMNAAYYYNDKDEPATFDLFIRSLPEDWGYFIVNGIEDAVEYITSIFFTDDDIAYLKTKGFGSEYLEFLRKFTFQGDVHAMPDGTPVFPNEPILRVSALRTQAQFIETTLLNIINFQTMIATKASRVVHAAAPAGVVDFGLRRAHEEDAGMKGARAAYIAGAVATSNVKAGKIYDIPIAGTHAHSFVMGFENELEAFRAYAKIFPENPTLLIDTYDTLQGARNAAVVAGEMKAEGKRLGAVRLDSGDLPALARQVRSILDQAGYPEVKIVASNDLNEYLIDDHKNRHAPIDLYGVGTELITAKPVAAIPGVYKLVEDSSGPKIKLSSHKRTVPGIKQVYRRTDTENRYCRDIIALDREQVEGTPLLQEVVRKGKRVRDKRDLQEIRQHCLECTSRLPEQLRKTRVTETYKVCLSDSLQSLIDTLVHRFSSSA